MKEKRRFYNKKVLKIIETLRSAYPDSLTMLQYRTPFQLLVATMLSAQCMDKKVNEVTAALFNKYKTVTDFAKARSRTLENNIRSLGLYRNKTKNIIASANKILNDFKGKVPSNIKELVSLPGVARKTANVVLSSAFKKADGIAVDTHVKRLSKRLGFSKREDPNKIERDLMQIIPQEHWLDFNYILVNHGRETCKARNPLCKSCCLKKNCPAYKKLIR